MSNNNVASAEMVFEYTGKGCVVPKNVTIVRFHLSVTEVENHAFHNCKQLREVEFHEGLQKIGHYAFLTCTSLSTITLTSTVVEIGEEAFNNCRSLREVVLNEGLQKIGRAAFFCCASLSSITLPSTVTEIGLAAFSGCRLSSIVLPSTVTEIGQYTFEKCSNLREVVFHEGLQKIVNDAFQNCTSLERFTLPSTVIEIDNSAFYNCNNLREVVFHGIPRKIGGFAFQECRSLVRFTFPTISTRLDNLIQTGHWEDIENEVNEVRGVVEVSDGELFVSSEAMDEGRNWNRVRESLDKIVRLISYYEIKGGTSIFELALWKFKLDQVDAANPIPRKKCHMDVPGPVKDIILQYLS